MYIWRARTQHVRMIAIFQTWFASSHLQRLAAALESRHCWNLFCPHVESRRQDKERLFPEWTDLGQCRISLGHENLPRLAYFLARLGPRIIHTHNDVLGFFGCFLIGLGSGQPSACPHLAYELAFLADPGSPKLDDFLLAHIGPQLKKGPRLTTKNRPGQR